MSERPREQTEMHTRLLKCALEVDDSRVYWTHADGSWSATAQQVFDEDRFGARSLARIDVLLSNMRARFDAFPPALPVLHRWPSMSPDARRVICHWHRPLTAWYRSFTGAYLVGRRAGRRVEVTRDLVVGWIAEHGRDSWTMATRIQFAEQAALRCVLGGTDRCQPRPASGRRPACPGRCAASTCCISCGNSSSRHTADESLSCVGGARGRTFEQRVRALKGLEFRRQADLLDYAWRYPDLRTWADATVALAGEQLTGVAR